MRAKILALGIALSLGQTALFSQDKLSPTALQAAANNNDFGFRLYAELAKEKGNLFFSPYSISNALAMTYAGARSTTAEQMKTALHLLQEPAVLHPAFREINEALLGKDPKRPFELRVANRLFGQMDYGFLPEFLKIGAKYYGGGLQEVDFVGDTEGSRRLINKWVEDQTNGRIQDLIQKGMLTVDSRLVLTNAIYFKASWLHVFPEKNTKPGDFILEGGKTTQVPMMRSNIRTGYYMGEGVQALEMPYGFGELSMVVLMPEKDEPFARWEKKLTQANLKRWIGKLGDHLVDVHFPKFKFASEFTLNTTLAEMGMRDAFNPTKADFSGMSSREKLFISFVVHKAFVDVNEKGTEAAAATAVGIGTTSVPRPATFHANRPFVFLIQERETGSILFMGRVSNPKG